MTLQVWPHLWWVERKSHICPGLPKQHPLILPNDAQGTISLYCYKTHCSCSSWSLPGYSRSFSAKLLCRWAMPSMRVVPAQGQEFALPLVEFPEVPVSPFLLKLRFPCMAAQSSTGSATPVSFGQSADLLSVLIPHAASPSRSLMKVVIIVPWDVTSIAQYRPSSVDFMPLCPVFMSLLLFVLAYKLHTNKKD